MGMTWRLRLHRALGVMTLQKALMVMMLLGLLALAVGANWIDGDW